MKIRNWTKFQHYKHRKPPWIRLYRELLEDPDWMNQEDEGKALLCELWMVASDTDDGSLPAIEALAWRLRRSIDSIKLGLSAINTKFLEGASEVLAECEQDAPSEKRRVTEQSRVEIEGERQHTRDGKPLDEIECPGCTRSGNLRQFAARGSNPPGFWCDKRGGCGANWPLNTEAILSLMTPRGRKAIEAMLPASEKPYVSPGMILTSELKFDENGMLIE